MLYSNYKNLYLELSPDGGVARTSSLETWLKITLTGCFLLFKVPLILDPSFDNRLQGLAVFFIGII